MIVMLSYWSPYSSSALLYLTLIIVGSNYRGPFELLNGVFSQTPVGHFNVFT